jgi:hypothetical protein
MAAVLLLAMPADVFAHAMALGDKGFIMCVDGVLLGPFTYLGAKHMVTGYDHLLFLLGVIFFLYRARDIGLYVTLFALGHSITLLAGVLGNVAVSPYLIDAIIGLSVVYKALDNLGVYQRWVGFSPDARWATLCFGLCHGLGLAGRLIDLDVSPLGLVPNLIAFNVGVEVGQLLALGAMLIAINAWRRTPSFTRHATRANVGLAVAGVALIVYQVVEFLKAPGT